MLSSQSRRVQGTATTNPPKGGAQRCFGYCVCVVFLGCRGPAKAGNPRHRQPRGAEDQLRLKTWSAEEQPRLKTQDTVLGCRGPAEAENTRHGPGRF